MPTLTYHVDLFVIQNIYVYMLYICTTGLEL